MMIRNNIPALQAHRNMWTHSNSAAKSLERICSGSRINRAADDPAGLAISEKMRTQIGILEKQMDNTRLALAEVRTLAEKLETANGILQRINELSIQAASDTLTDEDRELLDTEFQELLKQLQTLVGDFKYNAPQVLDVDKLAGAFADNLTLEDFAERQLQEEDPGEQEEVPLSAEEQVSQSIDSLKSLLSRLEDDLAADETSLYSLKHDVHRARMSTMAVFGTGIGTREDAQAAIENIKSAINAVSGMRARYGAQSNALEDELSRMQDNLENLMASESTIRDADIAAEIVKFTREQILTQAAQVAMSQAMDQPMLMTALLKTLTE